MSKHYDLLVIGGGSGGIAGARRAAEYGARVALIENQRMGGTCVNVGCVPKKMMWNAAHFADGLTIAEDYGFPLAPPIFNWARFKTARDAFIERLNGIYARNLESSNVDTYRGWAVFESVNSVRVGDQVLTADHVLIATGGRPATLKVPGADLAITSDGFFELESQPQNPLIIGAGYIATELAGVLQSLGSSVTMLLRKDILLRGFDHTLREAVTDEMQSDGVKILTWVQLQGLKQEATGALSFYDESGTHHSGFDCVILATGRTPATDAINLEATGLTTDPAGFILTDEWQQTAISNIYAVGDVTGRAALTPVAIAAARRLSDRLLAINRMPNSTMNQSQRLYFRTPPLAQSDLVKKRRELNSGTKTLRSIKVDLLICIIPSPKNECLQR